MGRIRTIKPEFTQDEELSSLPAETHLLAAGLLCFSDDEGYFRANPALVKAAVYPLRETSVSIPNMLADLTRIGFIRLGTAEDGKHYGQVVKFNEHQRVNRPSPSKIRALAISWGDSGSTHGALIQNSLWEGKGKEGKGTNPSSEQNGCSDQVSAPTERKAPSKEAFMLAALLKAEILRNKPDCRITPQQERKWATTAQRMLDIDKRDPQKIADLIRWVQRDEFWMANVLSMDTFREKFDQLALKAKGRTKVTAAVPLPADYVPASEQIRREQQRQAKVAQ